MGQGALAVTGRCGTAESLARGKVLRVSFNEGNGMVAQRANDGMAILPMSERKGPTAAFEGEILCHRKSGQR